MPTETMPLSYEECLKEMQDVQKAMDIDGWAEQTLPNTGPEITREMFQMTDEELQEWADKIDRLVFPKR
jgi:hypothetical protein